MRKREEDGKRELKKREQTRQRKRRKDGRVRVRGSQDRGDRMGRTRRNGRRIQKKEREGKLG